jgi:hypothetical protein
MANNRWKNRFTEPSLTAARTRIPSSLVTRPTRLLTAALIALVPAGLSAAEPPLPEKVKFNRDVRPILSDKCFHCHGFDAKERKADRRLDVREGALADNDGIKAIVPGNLEESDAWIRIASTDRDEVMPPPKGGKPLSDREREILRRWIAQGAEYEEHWAYVPPKRPEVPATGSDSSGTRNAIDRLVQAQLAERGLKPSPAADKRTLLRRLAFDLIGLPPTPAELEEFVSNEAPEAYEKAVERYLSSPHFGERMAIPWLDVVRFADTIGYHSDNPRNVWPYRDYVIRSFNENKRFDQFTREQIAGDLLPQSGQEQKVASGFNRLLLTTEEGGAQAKDYESRMLTDRVRAVGSAWLGATIGCAQCHDHKFDPIKAKDFYAMGAFFADIDEPAIGRREDGMIVKTPEQEAALVEHDQKITSIQAKLQEATPSLAADQIEWELNVSGGKVPEPAWSVLNPMKLEGEKGSTLTLESGGIIRSTPPPDGRDVHKLTIKTDLPEITGFRIEALKSSRLPALGPGNGGNGNFVISEVTIESNGARIPIATATATYEQPEYPAKEAADGAEKKHDNGWAIDGRIGTDQSLYLELAEALIGPGEKTFTITIRYDYGEKHTLGKFRLHATGSARPIRAPGADAMPKDVVKALSLPLVFRTAAQKEAIATYYRTIAPVLEPVRSELARAKKSRDGFESSLPRTLVSKSMKKPRTVRLLPRGNWMDESGPIIDPALPEFLAARNAASDKRLTRLDLAEWLVSRENPLTARVFVNRLWKQFFGTGLSKVLDDFGAQGEPPVNPDLLDWLACEFMDSGWDIKHMVRLIVTSHAYRQSSASTKELDGLDPENRLIARQSRWRLDAELVRDNALSIGGLLVLKIGGPSVKPYQPEDYWENLNFPQRTYEASTGEDQYRRGLYTWWQRSFVHPSMLAFDAPTREECAADRVRSNIPQQALVLLNDPSYVEAARSLATRVLKEPLPGDRERIIRAFEFALQRKPADSEIDILLPLIVEHERQFTDKPDDAAAFMKVGATPPPAEIPPARLAAWSSAARIILNLHETVTRQ